MYSKNRMKNIIYFLKAKKIIIFGISDIILVGISIYLAFFMRFDGIIPSSYIKWLPYYIIGLAVLNIIFLLRENLYAFTWSFVGLSELIKLIRAITYANIIFSIFVFLGWNQFPPFIGFPRSVLFVTYVLNLLFIGSLRIFKRLFLEIFDTRAARNGEKTLIVGAGDEGEQIIRNIKKNHIYNVIGIVDNQKNKLGTSIHGIEVLGSIKEIPTIITTYGIESVIIALTKGHADEIRDAIIYSREAKIQNIKIVPDTHELLSGKLKLTDIREVKIEDLLGRAPAKIETDKIFTFIKGKTVLITGAAGSIGSELSRQCALFEPKKLVILDFNESGIFDLENELMISYPKIRSSLYSVIANINNKERINRIFSQFSPDVIFHAAAYKHVPLMENHPEEAIETNVLGTLILGEAAIKNNVPKFVLISTDKAINPKSIMGKTKRAEELIMQALNQHRKTKFIAVRFGNVIGSRGSVIPLFQDQIRKRAPITVTHPDMSRYFMTIPEAALLVMEAGAVGIGGEIFMLDMGKPVKIVELARTMIRLSGLEPDVDIPIVFSGVRPGEKIEEEIFSEEEKRIGTTQWDKIFITKTEREPNLDELMEKIKEFREIINGEHEHLKKKLDEFIL